MAFLLGTRGSINSISKSTQLSTGKTPVNVQQLGGVRYGANLKAIRGSIVSVKNIEKITKTMKMIASSRLKAAQTKMELGRPFYEGGAQIMDAIPAAKPTGKNLILAVSADRGLCGSINSSIAKYVRNLVKARPDSSIICIGDRGASMLARDQAERILWSAGDLGRGFSFDVAALLADKIVTTKEKFDNVVIVYNRFNSVVSFTVMEQNMDWHTELANRPEFDKYEFEEDSKAEHLQDFFEFQLSSSLFHAVTENHASELGARMSAMDSASKNAKEMLKLLNVTYNRGRQAAITTELSEIIGGASAVQDNA